MGATMVDMNRSPKCKVRLVNAFANDVDLRRDAELCVAGRVEKVVVAAESNRGDSEPINLICIQLDQGTGVHLASRTFDEANESEVLESLIGLYIKSTEDTSEKE